MRVFITGANRGIGLALTKEICAVLKPQQLFATFRNVDKSKELYEFAKTNSAVQLVQLDVREDSEFDEVVSKVDESTRGQGINLLINNAGIGAKYTKLSAVRKEHLLENYLVNTVAPILLTKSFLPLLEKAADFNSKNTEYCLARGAVINLSSILGSIGDNADNGGMYPYRCSKAALNAATRNMSIDFQKHKILAVALHPGWVMTDLGGPKAPVTPEQSAQGIVTFLKSLNESHNGGFYDFNGTQVDW